MKILMLFPYAPLPPPLDLAGTKRNLPFLLELVKYHRVSVLSFGTPAEEKLFRSSYASLCQEIRFLDRKRPRIFSAIKLLLLLATGRSSFRMLHRRAMQRAINEMTSAQSYDLIHSCDHMYGYFSFPPGIPVTSDTHEVKHDLVYRIAKHSRSLPRKAYGYLCYWLGKREEIALCKKFDLLIATTERDLKVFRQHLPHQSITVIQNGAGNSFFEDLGIEPEPCTMVFTGLFTHQPNSQGIMWFLDEIFPRILAEEPKARVYIVGKSPTQQMVSRAAENVIVTGFVDDVRPFIARSQVFIIPLLAGGGIRGKALEAMAMRRPIVTTTIGVEGIHLQHEKSALLADTPEQFVRSVVRLFRDPALRQRIAHHAHTTSLQSYRWEAKGLELESALRSSYRARLKIQPHPLSETLQTT